MDRRRLAFLPFFLVAACDDAPAEIRAANACIPDAAGNAWSLTDASDPGPYSAGNHEFVFVDASRATPAHDGYAGAPDRTLRTIVWYPALATGVDTAPAAGGPFPVVLYSHGFSSNRNENMLVAEHLASHGYVVISPRFPVSAIDAEGGPSGIDIADQPRDLTYLLDTVAGLSASGDPRLSGMVDTTRVAAVGLSYGGLTTMLVTFHATLRDPRVDVAVGLAPVTAPLTSTFYTTTDAPVLVMHGTSDSILPYVDHAAAFRDRARAPRTLVTLAEGSHTAFTQISTLFEGQAGYEHADSLGCSFLGIPPDSIPGPRDELVSLLGAENGIEAGMPVGALCPAEPGVSMLPSRQILLENATVRAHLDAYLSDDAKTRGRACHFVERVLPRERDVDVDRL